MANWIEDVAQPMKVARVTHFFPPKVGGLEFHAYELTRRLAGDGHETHVFTRTANPLPVPPLAHVHTVTRWAGWQPPSASASALMFWATLWPLLRAEHKVQPFDLIHAHGDAADAWALGYVGRRLGVPTVLTMHGGLSSSKLYRSLAGRAFRGVDHIMGVSAEICADLVALGVDPHRVTVRSSGMDYQALQQVELARAEQWRAELGPGRPLILCVGRLHPVKGMPVLIEASARLAAAGEEHLVLIVGAGPAEARLRELARHGARVVFLGERTKAEIATLLQLVDLFVLPSVVLPGQAEGTPTALLEAMAAGVPCVISTAVATRGLLEPGVDGLVTPAGEAESLARALRELMHAPERRLAMGWNAKAKVKDRDWQRVAEDVRKIYQQVVKGQP